MRLEGKVAIVTGGGQGIGLAYVQRFLSEGARVVIAEIDPGRGAVGLAEAGDLGEVEYVRTDVSDPESCQACADAAVERFGGIDILVNNAALYGDWDMSDQSYAYLKRMFDVNLHGVWLMTRAVAPAMVEGGGGRIVNQASGAAYNYASAPAGEFAGLGSYSYSQTKWGVVGLTKFSAAQLGRYRITVNCIAPGVVGTDATLKQLSEDMLDHLSAEQPIPGRIQVDDLTGAAVFFASDDAGFVTGQVLVIDGGRHMPA
ncbi:MAG: SDR family oxidoreductase [Proteobacteria bacterium]|nr:SDR family oxidoreductase [Pseudomonadota bacterium]